MNGTGYRLWGNRLACFPTTSHGSGSLKRIKNGNINFKK